MTTITLQGLYKRFGQTVAVDHVDLTINAGDLFFLLGPSGCGKTTLLRMIAGFTEPTGGAIRFGDDDVTHQPANRRHCGMVFQNYALWPHMTVRQNVAFGLDVRKVAAEEKQTRVSEALSLVQMLAYADRKPNELSGGQQQRVALARALVIKPTVLLLDEPLSNLDAKLRLEMRGQIKRICAETDITSVYVTHDQKEALSMADGVAVLHQGKVVQVGPPRELYDRPASRFVADFLGETNFITAQTEARADKVIPLTTSAGRLRSTTCPDKVAAGVSVTCSIRPEAIRLVQAGETIDADKTNYLEGRRIDTVYLGERAQHQVAVGDDLVLKVFELNPRPLRDSNGKVRIAFDPADVVILKD